MGSRDVPALTPGTTDMSSTVLTVPSNAATGTLWLIAKADGPNAFSEPNEVNNMRYASVRIGPDLAVATLTVPAVAGPGSTINVSETIENQGAGHSAASSTRFYLSTNLTFDAADESLGTRSVGALAPGDSSAGTTTVTIPTNVSSGTFYVIAVADDGNGGPGIKRDQQQPLDDRAHRRRSLCAGE